MVCMGLNSQKYTEKGSFNLESLTVSKDVWINITIKYMNGNKHDEL